MTETDRDADRQGQWGTHIQRDRSRDIQRRTKTDRVREREKWSETGRYKDTDNTYRKCQKLKQRHRQKRDTGWATDRQRQKQRYRHTEIHKKTWTQTCRDID